MILQSRLNKLATNIKNSLALIDCISKSTNFVFQFHYLIHKYLMTLHACSLNIFKSLSLKLGKAFENAVIRQEDKYRLSASFDILEKI